MKKFIIPVLIIAFLATGCKTETKKTESNSAQKKEFTDEEKREIERMKRIDREVLEVIPVSLKDIAAWSNREGHGYPGTVQWMRMLWKNGQVRYFFKGYWANAVKGNVTGLRHGVHYLW